MKLAFCSISVLDRSLEEAARLAAATGLDGLEVTARPPHLDPQAGPAEARELGEAVRAAGVEITAYGSYLGHAGRTSPEAARSEVEIAAALETSLLRVWAERIRGEGDDLRGVVAWMRAACDAAAGLGVAVVVERHIGSLADTPERVESLLESVERDNLALNYQVLDFLPANQLDAQPTDAARLVRHALYFHLKNYRLNPDDPSGRVLPGGSLEDGVLDYPAILRAALGAGYRGPLAIEFLSSEPKPVEEKLAADVAFLRRELAAIRAEEASGGGAP